MAKPELGTKRECPKCASKFYDLKKNPAECPICHHGFDPTVPVRKRGKKKTVKMAADDAAEKVMAATASKKRTEIEDDEDIDLPEFEDLGVMEAMDDLDDMEDVDVVSKKVGGEDDDVDDETFIDDDGLIPTEDDRDDYDDEEDEER